MMIGNLNRLTQIFRELEHRLIRNEMRAHLNYQLNGRSYGCRDVLLLFVSFKPPFVPIIRAHDSGSGNFVRIIEKPLQELHIVLKLSISHLFNLNSFVDL